MDPSLQTALSSQGVCLVIGVMHFNSNFLDISVSDAGKEDGPSHWET